MAGKKPSRLAVIDRELCSPQACGFYLCQKSCPINRSGQDCITVSELDKKPLIGEDLCIGCGICVSPDTLIAIPDGVKPISEIKVGDCVLSHKGNWEKVTRVFDREYSGPLFKVYVYGEPEPLIVTEQHPILTVPRKYAKKNRLSMKITDPVWMDSNELKKGYYVLTPVMKGKSENAIISKNVKNARPIYKGVVWEDFELRFPLNEDIFRLIGYYLSEGYADDRRLTFSFHRKEREYIEDVKKLLEKLFNVKVKETKNTGQGINVRVDSSKVARFFHIFGTSCFSKRIPEELVNSDPSLQKQLLLSMWYGDGSFDNKRGYFNITTTSRNLASQIKQIFARNGVICSIARTERNNRRPVYHINVFADSVQKTADMFNRKIDDKRNRTCGRMQIDKNYIYSPIRKIETEIVKNFKVINLEVENDETYVASGIAVHNCVKKCPKGAIDVVNLPAELKENPIHRYGQNMFVLYRIPVPKKNSVIGLIGPNGVGKSTVLNILSGNLKPNTGLLKRKEVPWDEIIERFKGTELQDYLESLSQKKIRSAYKPQQVDIIPKLWKGKVSEMLHRIEGDSATFKRESGSLNVENVVKSLGLKEMLGKEIKDLSGGELQLLAIAATMLKEADFYFFDEPSSYLDAYERLLVAKEIRRLSERAVVMVVEHDLAVADYLADYTHILYGKPGVFGVVSKPYGVRVGINTYLEGYIQEENVRFRPEPIIFSRVAKTSEKTKPLLEFSGFGKSFRDFSLRTEPGTLHKGEVIGILGPNSTGKTTFIRMLTGELKPDKGEPIEGMKLSYKPQRLVLDGDTQNMIVEEFIRKKRGKLETEDRTLLRHLGVEKLFLRTMHSLSGGELQAVFISACLLQDAEILLLDEPAAFLDVEQRLRVAKLIRHLAETKEIPCFVVDHDLQFMDAVSDKVMVFEGIPGKNGHGLKPCSLEDGMNRLLKSLGVTYRRDPHTGRPRANKPGSQKDIEQKDGGRYYYS